MRTLFFFPNIIDVVASANNQNAPKRVQIEPETGTKWLINWKFELRKYNQSTNEHSHCECLFKCERDKQLPINRTEKKFKQEKWLLFLLLLGNLWGRAPAKLRLAAENAWDTRINEQHTSDNYENERNSMKHSSCSRDERAQMCCEWCSPLSFYQMYSIFGRCALQTLWISVRFFSVIDF